ncbi:S1 family peptidase [Halobacillus mangrovi]|uniref:Serine protease n=1 Tax=Halobacillus mangrovi TaxID=402384 RepID=A0A1W5ZZL9_9BACI|nr:serine protease [Halobacillus mangrovi]ARI78806.1 serine protease [Halobacillus mangrovi]
MNNVVFSVGKVVGNTYHAAGTCTMLNKENLLVTAAHVVNGSDDNLYINRNTHFHGDYQDTTKKKLDLLPVKIEAIDPLRDVCLLSLDDKIAKGCSIFRAGNTDNINTGDAVTVFGFPHSNLGRIVLTQQSCEVGAKILLSSKKVKSKHLVLNIQARPGQSGAPVIRKSDRSLIAILIGAYVPTIERGIDLGGIDPQTLHQTTHAVSAEYIERML